MPIVGARPWGQHKPEPGYPLDTSSPLSRGLVGAWLLNEGGGLAAADLSGNGNALAVTPATGTGWGPGYFGHCYASPGSVLWRMQSASRVWSLSAFTLSIWMRRNGTSDGVGGIGSTSKAIFLVGGSQLLLYNSDGTTTNQALGYTWPTPSNSWHHYAFQYTGTQMLISIDGKLSSSATVTSPPTFYTGAVPFTLGGLLGFTSLGGAVDNAAFYSRALSAWEVGRLYSEPFDYVEGIRRRRRIPKYAKGSASIAVGRPSTSIAGTATLKGSLSGRPGSPSTALAGTSTLRGSLAARPGSPTASAAGKGVAGDFESAVATALSNTASITAIVGSRVSPLRIPEDATLPALSYRVISGPRLKTLDGPCGIADFLLEVDARSFSYGDVKALRKALLLLFTPTGSNLAELFGIELLETKVRDERDSVEDPADDSDDSTYVCSTFFFFRIREP